jgi:chromosome segregation and condensation protein ScpB
MNIAHYQELFIQNYQAKNKTIEETLLILRQEGASLKVLINVLNLSIQEADEIILNSKACVHLKNSSIRFREEFGDYLENIEKNT